MSDTEPESTSAGIPLAPVLLVAGVLGVVFAWAYWPTLTELLEAWRTQPDYSHGYLVVPVAIYLLWIRRRAFPGIDPGFSIGACSLLALSIAVRLVSAFFFIPDLDGWSIPLWVAGVVWLICGSRAVWWAAPAIGFLIFMVPLPYRVERWMSLPLQETATKVSTWCLQLLGQPALAEGNLIYIGDTPLFVEEACAGLRIFAGIAALAYAYVAVVDRSWWIKAIVALSALPIAIVANSTRIVVTACVMHFAGEDTSGQVYQFTHDWAGFIMIPFAALLFGAVLSYTSHLFRYEQTVKAGALGRRRPQPA